MSHCRELLDHCGHVSGKWGIYVSFYKAKWLVGMQNGLNLEAKTEYCWFGVME